MAPGLLSVWNRRKNATKLARNENIREISAQLAGGAMQCRFHGVFFYRDIFGIPCTRDIVTAQKEMISMLPGCVDLLIPVMKIAAAN